MLYESAYYGIAGFGDNSLYHHGIKGQKWGIRRFQNPDGSLTDAGRKRYLRTIEKASRKGIRSEVLRGEHTVPKGTTIYRTTDSSDEKLGGYKYVSYINADRDLYNSGYIRIKGKTGEAYEHEYQLQQDIKVPSRDELKSVVSEMLQKDPDAGRNVVKARLDVIMPEGSEARYYASVDTLTDKYSPTMWKQYVDDQISEFKKLSVDDAFIQATQSFGLNPGLRQKVIKELSARGYNAMTDEASVGGSKYGGIEGQDPLILFDSSVLKEVGTRKINSQEERETKARYDTWKRRAQIRTKKKKAEW